MTNRISTITLLTAISISIIFSFIIIWDLKTVFKNYNEANHEKLKEFYTKQQKSFIENEVKRLIVRIKAAKENTTENIKIKLKETVDAAEAFAEATIKNSDKELWGDNLELFTKSFVWEDNTAYFFVFNDSGIIIHHGTNSEAYGKDLEFLSASYPELASFIEKTYEKGEAFGTYLSPKPGDNKKIYEKLGYAKFNRDLGILIGTAIFMDNLNKVVQDEIIATIRDERFGYRNYGYFWIYDSKHNSIFHIDPSMNKRNHYNLQDINGKYVVREFVDMSITYGKGYSEYFWNLPEQNKSSKKISYLEYYKEWDWIIGTGFYFENFDELITAEENLSAGILKDMFKQNAYLILAVFTTVMAVSLFIYKKIRKIEDDQEIHINDLIQHTNVIESSTLVSVYDPEGVITHVNEQLCDLTGFEREKFIGSKYNIISHPDNPESTYLEIWQAICIGITWRGIIKSIKADGEYFYQKTTIVPFKDKDGTVIKYVSVSHDVTEEFENRSKLQKYIHIDSLTELGNRATLIKEIKASESSDLALIDIDGFHKINENYGMRSGDKTLKEFAHRLSEDARLDKYKLFRLHSDVFAIFSPLSDQDTFVRNVEDAVRDITKDILIIEDAEIILRTITGYAKGSANILTKADTALNFAKTNNISHYIYDPQKVDASEVYENSAKVVKLLSRAIEEDAVVPYYQPIVSADRKDVKYECLMRITLDGSVMLPGEFIEISKQTRFYPYMTKIVAQKAIEHFADKDNDFSINISAEDIHNRETMDFIYSYAIEKGVISNMILEIVETESLTASPEVTETLYKFKLAGAKIAIDDFGTGYSNFDYLLKIKADIVKIDGSIVRLINKDDRAKDIFISIVSYAKKMNMETVAEFVSDAEIYNTAISLGVNFAQGYHTGAPSADTEKSSAKAV